MPLQDAQPRLECACERTCEPILQRRLHVAGLRVRGDGSRVHGHLHLARGTAPLQHRSEARNHHVVHAHLAHEVLEHVDPARRGSLRLQRAREPSLVMDVTASLPHVRREF